MIITRETKFWYSIFKTNLQGLKKKCFVNKKNRTVAHCSKIIYSFIEKYISYDFISALKCSAFPLLRSLVDPHIIWVVCFSEVAFLGAIAPYTELCTLFLFSMKLHFTNPVFAVKGHHSHSWNFIQWTGN